MRQDDQTTQIQRCIDRLRAGDKAAREELLAHSRDRLLRLTRKMLRDFPGVKRQEETDDVFQEAAMRLWRALQEVQPTTAADFFRLAAALIRRELLDLARRHSGASGLGAQRVSRDAAGKAPAPAGVDPVDTTHDPGPLAAWTDFHNAVESLAAEERDVFDLLYYQGLLQAEAAAVLGVSERTLKRRWQAARLRLAAAMGGNMPGL
jgi:RNA polymerase sigma-70 factor (ECF subfamily)